MRAQIFLIICLIVPLIGRSEDVAKQTPADEALNEAIAGLEYKLEKVGDELAKAKIRKAIRELESIRDGDSKEEKSVELDFDVKPALLKKKFKGKASYDPKSGELSLTYDLAKGEQLKDFELGAAKPKVADRILLIEGGDRISHLARFKSFTVKGLWSMRAGRGGGVGSSNGSIMKFDGEHYDTIFLVVAGGEGAAKIIPKEVQSGTIPFQFSVTPSKTMLQYAEERLTQPTEKKTDIHQVVFNGGVEGYGFSKITISGIPEPKWFREFLLDAK